MFSWLRGLNEWFGVVWCMTGVVICFRRVFVDSGDNDWFSKTKDPYQGRTEAQEVQPQVRVC